MVTHAKPRTVSLWAALVPVVGVLAGALFSSSSHAARGADLRTDTVNMSDLIVSQARINQERSSRIATIQSEVEALTKQAAPGDAAVTTLNDQADTLALEAGRTDVQGSGLSVSLDDSPLRGDQIPAGMTVDDVVVHQQDVQAVVNALWRGGAEAMMIQDQRVISTSAVRCVGNTLILQGRVYSPPFVIKAIGDPAALRSALDADPTVQIYKEYVQAVRLGYTVSQDEVLRFPAYAGSVRLSYAQAAPRAGQ